MPHVGMLEERTLAEARRLMNKSPRNDECKNNTEAEIRKSKLVRDGTVSGLVQIAASRSSSLAHNNKHVREVLAFHCLETIQDSFRCTNLNLFCDAIINIVQSRLIHGRVVSTLDSYHEHGSLMTLKTPSLKILKKRLSGYSLGPLKANCSSVTDVE